MANYSTLGDLFTGIADAIRAKNGSAEVIVADNFPIEIQNLKTGFDYNNHNVITIPDYGFKNCTNLRSVDCYSLTSVGTSAFENCKSLKTVILYDGVTEVNENAFKGCEGLTIYCYFDKQPDTWNESWNPDNCEVIWLGGAVQTWDISATSEDSVTAKLYSNVQNNGTYSLIISGNGNMEDYNQMHSPPYYDYKSNILNVIIHNVTRIGDNAFSNCINLMNVSISSTVASIGEAAFSSCESLNHLSVPNNVSEIGAMAFQYCKNLTSITISGRITKIDYRTFGDCEKLKTIIIPDGVTSIDDHAFNDCYRLTSIIIPSSVTSIGNHAFYNVVKYFHIIFIGTISQWKGIALGNNWTGATSGIIDYTIYCTDGEIAKDGTITYH